MSVKVGDLVELVHMGDDPDPVRVGQKGTVTEICELTYFKQTQIWVNWDCGRHLAVVLPVDKIKVLNSN